MKPIKDWRWWSVVVVSGFGLCTLRAASLRRLQSSIPNSQPPKVGNLAPDFTLTDYNGKTYRLSDFRGKRVLLNFFCGCGSCAELAVTWEKIHRQRPGVQVLGISTINPETIQDWRRSLGVTFPALLDPNYGVAARYASTDCPRCWVIDERGKVVYISHEQYDLSAVTQTLQHLFISDK